MSSHIVVTQGTSTITPCQKFKGHTEWVGGAIHLPGGQRIMTCSWDGSLRVWNMKSGKQIGDDWRDGESGVRRIAMSPDGKNVVSGSHDGGVRLWDIDTGKVIVKWMGHIREVKSVCWSQDGRRVLSGSDDGTARQWVVESGETILAPIETGHHHVYTAVYSPDMTMFATGGEDELSTYEDEKSPAAVKIWDVKTGKLVATLKGHTDSVWCLAWTPDGKILISGSFDYSIRTWSTTTWKQLAVLDEHTDIAWAIAVSPNGRILAGASYDETARLWNLDNSKPINSPLHHADKVISVSFSADGKLLATGCCDTNAYTWDVSAVLREAGLDELLLDVREGDKSVLNATQRPVRQPIKVPNRIPRGFFDDQPPRAHVSARPDAHDLPFRLLLFHWVRNLVSGTQRRPSGAEIELHEHRSTVVDVPYAKGKRRNASAREKRRQNQKKAAASTSRPPNSNVTQQSSGVAQAQSSLQPQVQATVSTPSTTHPVVATPETTTSHHNPHVVIPHAGRWTRFWLFICCASTEYPDGHH